MTLEGEIERKNEERKEIGMQQKGKRRKIFWGLVLIVGAIVMLLRKLGLFEGVSLFKGMSFWQLLFSVLLAAAFLNGIFKKSFGQILFSMAFLIILNDGLLHLEAITPWPVLIAALVMTIGLKMLFPGFRRNWHWDVNWSTSKLTPRSERAEGALSYDNAFGNEVKYIAGAVDEVYLKNSFGEMEVYFSDALLKGGVGRIHLSSSFGAVRIYVPGDWKVILNLDTAFGDVGQDGENKPDGGNTLYIDGEVAFGELKILYIRGEKRAELMNPDQGGQTI